MEIVEIKERTPKAVTLPDGVYCGLWGGSYSKHNPYPENIIRFNYEGKSYELTTEECARGFNIKVVVTIKGEMTFDEKD